MKKVICSQKAPGAIGPYSQAIEANGRIGHGEYREDYRFPGGYVFVCRHE